MRTITIDGEAEAALIRLEEMTGIGAEMIIRHALENRLEDAEEMAAALAILDCVEQRRGCFSG